MPDTIGMPDAESRFVSDSVGAVFVPDGGDLSYDGV
jgi:hypothetical protein